eukprot:gnl/Dysnectes_brevis/141_a166_6750.p1 GENE.gnl/Dysnectes_brevis/141_a166_6750~~gnl/Dysnectes_brevis/141_a166_6750.p1  ORF type:complete len:245 (+),score=63.11 gnl/Dysnectes_brevis/141_a166_6750:43-777(+)
MTKLIYNLVIGGLLLFCSFLTYSVHYWVFHDSHHIFIYLLGDIGFAFLEVIMITLIIENLMKHREKEEQLKKLYPTISMFFAKFGQEILGYISNLDPHANLISITSSVSKREFHTAARAASSASVSPTCEQLQQLRIVFMDRHDAIESPLANPNLVEHESFTDALLSLHHLGEELATRGERFTTSDVSHLTVDLNRAYRQLSLQWVRHLEHMAVEYPYMFDYAVRTCPFNSRPEPAKGEPTSEE